MEEDQSELAYELQKFMKFLSDVDDETLPKLSRAANGLPVASIIDVRRTLENKSSSEPVGTGYAIRAFRNQRDIRQAANALESQRAASLKAAAGEVA